MADFGAAEGYAPAKIRKLRIEDELLAEMGVGDLVWPEGLSLSGDGNIYCSDAYHHAILAYDSGGEQIARWGEQGWEAGQFQRPSGIPFDGDDNLLVVDTGNNRVQKFSKDGERDPGALALHGRLVRGVLLRSAGAVRARVPALRPVVRRRHRKRGADAVGSAHAGATQRVVAIG